MNKKILILGHGRHGKDSLAEFLEYYFGVTFISSSYGAAEAIFPWLQDRLAYQYEYVEEAFEDRHNHRELWKELITNFNTPDKSRLCRHIIENSDCYVGMRCQQEYEASKDLFDMVIWVDASDRVSYKDPTMGIEFDDSMYLVDNNGDLHDLFEQATQLYSQLALEANDVTCN